MYALLLCAFIYGLLEVFRIRSGSFDVNDYTSADILLVFSRACGKGITIFWTLGLIAAVRGFNNSANELSLEDKAWLNWRLLHSACMGLGILLALVHMGSHLGRIFAYGQAFLASGNLTYDYYQVGMGGSLFLAIAALAIYYPLRRSKNKRIAQMGSRWFRAAHWQLYWVIATIYAIHSYSMLPLLLWIVWTVDYYLHRVPIEKVLYVRAPDGRVVLVCRTGTFSPQGTGSYFQVIVGNGSARRSASYSAISTGARSVMFMIAPSVFTAHLEDMIRDVNYDYGVQNISDEDLRFLHSIVHLQDILADPKTVLWDLDRKSRGQAHSELPVSLYGPYHSNNSNCNNHPQALIITSGIGSTVRDAFVAHQLQKRGAWRRLICINLAGRTPHADPDISTLSDLCEELSSPPATGILVEHIELRCETNAEFWSRFLCAAIPRSPVALEDREGLTEDQVQELADQRRFVVVCCGKSIGELVQDAADFRGSDEHLSEEQLSYLDLEAFY